MTIFHKIMERALLLVFVFCFALVAVYVPQPEVVEARGALTGIASWENQMVDTPLKMATMISSKAASVSAAATQFIQGNLWLKEAGLDKIAWVLSKSILSRMTKSVVSWINSGFKGSPSFVTDLGGFLRDVADQEFATYLQGLDSNFSFLCAPFKLDIKIALSLSYQRIASETPAPSCTFSGMIDNVQKFTDSTSNFIDAGGWDTWFAITANPSQYTELGSFMLAESEMRARLVNAEGKELKLLDFGDGFLSSKNCQTINSGSTQKTQCSITTPGKVINETLTKQLGAGQDALVTADELNELMTALFSQIAVKAISGVNGLLGLSGGGGGSYINQMTASDPGSNPEDIERLISEQVKNENDMAILMITNRPLLLNHSTNMSVRYAGVRREALEAYQEIDARLDTVDSNEAVLNGLNQRLQGLEMLGPDQIALELMQISGDFTKHRGWHSKEFVESQRYRYESILNQ